MTPDQTKTILAKAALLDNRTVDLAVIKAWHEVVGHLDYRDAMAGLDAHRAESTDYLMPAHLIAQARKARRLREVHESRQRAITVAQEREALGQWATPIEVEELRNSLKTVLKSVS
jgi:hypothetical protein